MSTLMVKNDPSGPTGPGNLRIFVSGDLSYPRWSFWGDVFSQPKKWLGISQCFNELLMEKWII